MSQDSKLKNNLKFVGSGFRDNDFKLKFWKSQFKVPFPLVSDFDGKVFNALKLPGTPVHMIVNKEGKVVWIHVGGFENAQEIFKEIKTALKL